MNNSILRSFCQISSLNLLQASFGNTPTYFQKLLYIKQLEYVRSPSVWAGHVARMGEVRGMHRFLVGKPEGKSHWGDPDVDGKIILRWIFRKWEGIVGTGWS